MATPNRLWMGLLLLGVLGVLQTPAPAQAALQPNFEEDKVREGSLPGAETGRCPWGVGCSPREGGSRRGGLDWPEEADRERPPQAIHRQRIALQRGARRAGTRL